MLTAEQTLKAELDHWRQDLLAKFRYKIDRETEGDGDVVHGLHTFPVLRILTETVEIDTERPPKLLPGIEDIRIVDHESGHSWTIRFSLAKYDGGLVIFDVEQVA